MTHTMEETLAEIVTELEQLVGVPLTLKPTHMLLGTPRWAPYASWGAGAAHWQALFSPVDEDEDVQLWGFGDG